MMTDLKISQGEIALLSSAVNFGLALATFVVSPIMSVFKTKYVLVISFRINAFASFLFAFSSWYSILTLARFLLGFTQAFSFVYAPVWINEFSPKGQSTRWMATN
jgi:predicted MFS family arabinose efflux permease